MRLMRRGEKNIVVDKIVLSRTTQFVLYSSLVVLLIFAASTARYFAEASQSIGDAEFISVGMDDEVYWINEIDWTDDEILDWMDELYGMEEVEPMNRKKASRGESRARNSEISAERRQRNENRTPRSQRRQGQIGDQTEWNEVTEWLEMYSLLGELFGQELSAEEMLFIEAMLSFDPVFLREIGIEAHIVEAIIEQRDTDSAEEYVVRVAGIEYSEDGVNFFPVPDTLYVMVGTEIIFRAIPSVRSESLPTERMTWSGATRDSNDFAVARRISHTPSRSATTPTLITVSCGTSSATASVIDFHLILWAEGVIALANGSEHVAIKLNDVPVPHGGHQGGVMLYPDNTSWCANNCPGTSCDHRPFEPVFGLNFVGSLGFEDPNLVRFTLHMFPSGLPGSVSVTVNGVNDTIRLWASASNGQKGKTHVINGVSPRSAASLASGSPLTLFYVEGIRVGGASVTATYDQTNLAGTHVKSLPISVVSLVERQGSQRKVINEKDSIQFKIEGGDIFAGIANWQVFGNAFNHNNPSVPWQPTTSGSNTTVLTVDYSGLPENANNRQYTSSVRAQISSKVTLTRTVRVAQDGYHGVALAQITPMRRTQVQNLPVVRPLGFDNTLLPNSASIAFSQAWFENQYTGTSSPPLDPVPLINNARLQYAPNASGNLGEAAFYPARGADRMMFGTFILPDAYAFSLGFREGELTTIAHHEMRHAWQHIQVRNGGNDWRTLDNALLPQNYRSFREADALMSELTFSTTSWRFMTHGDSLPLFIAQYNSAMGQYNNAVIWTGTNGPNGRNAARAILRDIYNRVPFPEMKRPDGLGGVDGYDRFIRAPLP